MLQDDAAHDTGRRGHVPHACMHVPVADRDEATQHTLPAATNLGASHHSTQGREAGV